MQSRAVRVMCMPQPQARPVTRLFNENHLWRGGMIFYNCNFLLHSHLQVAYTRHSTTMRELHSDESIREYTRYIQYNHDVIQSSMSYA